MAQRGPRSLLRTSDGAGLNVEFASTSLQHPAHIELVSLTCLHATMPRNSVSHDGRKLPKYSARACARGHLRIHSKPFGGSVPWLVISTSIKRHPVPDSEMVNFWGMAGHGNPGDPRGFAPHLLRLPGPRGRPDPQNQPFPGPGNFLKDHFLIVPWVRYGLR